MTSPYPYPFLVSPVSGRINIDQTQSLPEDYIWQGNRQNIAQLSPVITDLKLDLIRLKQQLIDFLNSDFILGTPNRNLQNAQDLESLNNGFVYNTEGIVSTIDTIIPGQLTISTGKLLTGDINNNAIEIQTIPISNLTNLTYQNIWRGNNSNRPIESTDLTTLESTVNDTSISLLDLINTVSNLSNIVDAISSTVNALSSSVAAIEAGITLVGGFVALLALIAASASHSIQISVLQSDVNDIYNQIDAIRSELTSINEYIGSITLNDLPVTGDLDMDFHHIINLLDPVNPGDAVNLRTLMLYSRVPLWIDDTINPTTLEPNTNYVADNIDFNVFKLPLTAVLGDEYKIVGRQGSWLVNQNDNQYIKLNTSTTTTGSSGVISSTRPTDCITLTCTIANTEFTIFPVNGNINFS